MSTTGKMWKMEVTIRVADYWVEDGFTPTAERIKDAILSSFLLSAYSHELSVKVNKVIEKPTRATIKKLQG